MMETIGQYGIAAIALFFAWKIFQAFTRQIRESQQTFITMAAEICSTMKSHDEKMILMLNKIHKSIKSGRAKR